MKNENVRILANDTLYSGYSKIFGYTLDIDYFAGGSSGEFTRECLHKPPVVGVLPYDVRADKVVLIEQFRIGAYTENTSPWIYEIVAGVGDAEGEPLTDLAKRELYEETGLSVKETNYIMRYWVSPGLSNERLSLYWASVDSSKAKDICGVASEHEDIKVHVVSLAKAIAMLNSGVICNSLTIIALQWLQLNRDNLIIK